MTEASRRDLLIFQLGGRRFGLAVLAVQELIRAVGQTPLDAATTPFEGVIDLRGSLVPVLDLRRHLGMPPREALPSDHLIIARAGGRRVALRVDSALELTRLDCSADDEARGADGPRDWVEGLAKHAGYGVVPVLSLDALLRGRGPAGVGAAADLAPPAREGRPRP